MNRSTPGLPVHHQLLESTQTHVHWVGDAIQPSHPLSSPSPPAFNLSQHQGLFKWVSSSHQVAKVLEFHLQHQSFQRLMEGLISFRMDWLDLLAVQGTFKTPPTPHVKSINSSALSFLHSFSGTLAFSMIWWMLAIWSLVPLPFLKPAWTSGSSWFTYCWSLTWRILSVTLLACEMSAIVW